MLFSRLRGRLPLRCCAFLLPLLSSIVLAAILAATSAGPGRAQSLPAGLTIDQLQQLQQLQQSQSQVGRATSQAAVPDQPSTSVLLPEPAMQSQQPSSRLEQIMSQRAGVQLRLFGYEELGTGRAVTVNQAGAIQDDYVLGPGDEIVVSLRGQGQNNNDVRVLVDRNGQVVLPALSPISASGRSFGSFRQDIQAAVTRAYVGANAFVSLGRVRQVSVLVSGEVNTPGQRTVSGLSSVLDAILLSGGIRKSGSLRNVRLQRGGHEYVIDFYALLTDRGGSADMRLMDGDRIRVPLLGKTVAVTGLVRQPAIYELPPEQSGISVGTLMALAGGEEVRGLYGLSVLRVNPDGRTQMVSLPGGDGTIRDSEILFVQFGANQTVNRVTLAGGTNLAGGYPIAEGTKLSDILKPPGALGTDTYTLFGIISRRNPRTLLRTLMAFTPLAVLHGSEDLAMQSDDIVHVISLSEFRMLENTLHDYSKQQDDALQAMRNPLVGLNANAQPSSNAQPPSDAQPPFDAQAPSNAQIPSNTQIPNAQTPSNGGDQGDSAVSRAVQAGAAAAQDAAQNQRTNIQRLASRPAPGSSQPRGYAPATDEADTFNQMAGMLGVDQLVLTNFLLDHQATLNGSVRGPGAYLVGPNVALQDLLAAAGDAGNWTDASSVELISTAVDSNSGKSLTQLVRMPLNAGLLTSYVVKPHDEFRFNEVFNDASLGSVTVQGEVRFAGAYKLIRGERLSDLLIRAGGLTNVAFPYGTLFLRKSAAAHEQEAYMRAANQAEDQLLVAMTRVGNDKIDPSTFSAMQIFVTELRNQKALGRIAVQADPSVLAANPGMDTLLEPGDVIYIPPRPSTVTVTGQVMQSGGFAYRSGASVADYIAQAGGYGSLADESQTFVVLPDGSARRIERSWFHLDAGTALPPGSTIVVPRDLTPLDLRQSVIDITQILSQLAVTIASVAVLSK